MGGAGFDTSGLAMSHDLGDPRRQEGLPLSLIHI